MRKPIIVTGAAGLQKLRAAGYTRPFTSLEDAVMDYVTNYMIKQGKNE